jgi:hypothetical protein
MALRQGSALVLTVRAPAPDQSCDSDRGHGAGGGATLLGGLRGAGPLGPALGGGVFRAASSGVGAGSSDFFGVPCRGSTPWSGRAPCVQDCAPECCALSWAMADAGTSAAATYSFIVANLAANDL